MRDISKNIRELRVRNNLTQDTLAEMLHVTRQTVSNYETGRSRPDVDMLVTMAEVFNTDVNSILYGLPDVNIRMREKRHFIYGMMCSFMSGALVMLLSQKAQDLVIRGSYGLIISVRLLFFPLFLFFLGWSLMQGLSLITKAKSPQLRHGKYLRWAMLLVLGIYFVLVLPPVFHCIKTFMVEVYVESLVPPTGLRIGFSLRPELLNKFCGLVYLYVFKRRWLFFAAGILLWIFGPLNDFNWIKSLMLILLMLALGLMVYLCADSSFILEVDNPALYVDVPYNIKVEQYFDYK